MAEDDWVGQDGHNGGGSAPGGGNTWWDTIKSGAGYADEVLGDAIRAGTNAVTFGNMDRIAGAGNYYTGMGGPKTLSDVVTGKHAPRSYDEAVNEQVKLSEAARERSPYASIAGDVAGSMVVPAAGAEAFAARYGGGRLARAIGYGASGGAQGAAQGAGNTYTGNPSDYVENAGWGMLLGAPLGAAGGAIFGRGPAVSAAKTPNAADQGAVRDLAYTELRNHGARYTPDSFSGRAFDIENDLRMGRNAHELTSPQSFRTVSQMHTPPTMMATGRDYITPGDIDFVRKGVAGNEFKGMTPTDQGSATVVKRGIDEFTRNPPPGASVPGYEHLAADASTLSNLAHQLHAGTKRTELIEEMIRNSERTAGATHSGLNLRNELQKTIRTGLKEKEGNSPFSKAGYNDAEIEALDRFSRGQGRISQGLAYADKYLGGGGGLGALAAGAMGGKYLGGDDSNGLAAGLGTSGAGLALRMIGNRRATADINRIRELISQRNPLYQARVAVNPMVPGPGSPLAAKAVRDAATNAILAQARPRVNIDTTDWE